MIANYVSGKICEVVEYEVQFTDEDGNGFAFPCNPDWTLMPLNEWAQKNYEEAMAHPENFVNYNKRVRRVRKVLEPARGTCRCGETIELYAGWHGACECPKCGQWYNAFGQELLRPEQWEEV